MPQAQLQLILGTMQRLAVEAPENARALLQDNPQLCYALLHAQLILGLTLEPSLPPTNEEMQSLRAEAARRPTLATLVTPGAGVVVPPQARGMVGGPPRPFNPLGHPGVNHAVKPGVNPGVIHPNGLGLAGPLPPGLLPEGTQRPV